MAAIIKRNGKYLVRVRVQGFPPLSKTFIERRSAQVWAVQTEDDIRRGVFEFGKADIPTLGQALKKYRTKITPKKRGAKKEAYLIALLSGLDIAKKRMDQIQAVELARLRNDWLKALAPATVHRRMSVLAHVYTVAIKEWGHSLANPFALVTKPKVSNQRSRTVDWDELQFILIHSPNSTLPRIAQAAWYSGARLGELAALQWPNVNLQAGTALLEETKNGDAREIPLPPAAVALLETIKPETEPGERLTGSVFNTSSPSMSKAWAVAVKKARKAYEAQCAKRGVEARPGWLEDVTFHDLRHAAISRLASLGLSTLELQAISGHKTVQMLSRYSHIKAGALASKLARLEATA
ncbi:tyrosine-type recombinase/integrase [Pusillimonas noertemannii]|uniref:Site-specific recombinase XerD n=1 Tax=Pusillimonas noertemannii TaxID=305977 RepID=A0A2U1CNX7_9BURK|nr:tyrosine-type recombinase/integrase [Pusillimonas noertemannii]NYT68273.1 tyrosine-type recombinase/integrase [Pusillimonas noertemannii]PVY62712.1 site-specific recombinase XerD [Pusillimonas noertemannii]TFL10350.1 site-specific integrase [Pusillimonas noertemannii]